DLSLLRTRARSGHQRRPHDRPYQPWPPGPRGRAFTRDRTTHRGRARHPAAGGGFPPSPLLRGPIRQPPARGHTPGGTARRPRSLVAAAAKRLQEGSGLVARPVDRARLAEVELARRASLSFLAEASDLLAGTLDERMTGALAAQLITSRMGRWCAIHTTNDLGVSQLTHVMHSDENHNEILRSLLTVLPPPHQREPQPLWSASDLSGEGFDEQFV